MNGKLKTGADVLNNSEADKMFKELGYSCEWEVQQMLENVYITIWKNIEGILHTLINHMVEETLPVTSEELNAISKKVEELRLIK